MLNLDRWQTGPALVVALGMVSSAIAPFTIPTSASAAPASSTVAQLFPPPGQYPSGQYPYTAQTIPAGTRIPVRYDGADKVVVAPNETSPLTLRVASNIRNTAGMMLVPAGSEIRGKLVPSGYGSRFVSETLILPGGAAYPINADSRVVTRIEEVNQTNGTAIATGAAVGAGAATILSGTTGRRRITFGKILAGAGAGALGGLLLGKRRKEVVVIYPRTDLTLTLNSGLALR
ncbi:hypothetical protein J5X98_22815 [Leptothermofonsia sichuanensis E412]|uniref:hypothetical protein n=1 Tax=Leptothermofonsia sichuanensis TaxID=2917832 RepID=UPI001CA6AFBF|nr:hypothetical protein [Leptothermofonsia sichuanensis]QZZ20084.1 hypothetical protein J5X98_22815 [Leptothermofonsia sichuanensis E412]